MISAVLDCKQLATERNVGSLFKCKWHLYLFNDIPPHEASIASQIQSIPKISYGLFSDFKFNCRKYRARKNNCKNWGKKARNVCLSSMIASRNTALTNGHCYRHTVKKPSPGLLQFKTMSKRFPWHLVILLGSGFALAEACKVPEIYTGWPQVLTLKQRSHITKDLIRDIPSN